LTSLFLNLVTEEEVDYVLKQLPGLQFLNGLTVDRDELNAAVPSDEDDEEQTVAMPNG
jgi:hypothetical protein